MPLSISLPSLSLHPETAISSNNLLRSAWDTRATTSPFNFSTKDLWWYILLPRKNLWMAPSEYPYLFAKSSIPRPLNRRSSIILLFCFKVSSDKTDLLPRTANCTNGKSSFLISETWPFSTFIKHLLSSRTAFNNPLSRPWRTATVHISLPAKILRLYTAEMITSKTLATVSLSAAGLFMLNSTIAFLSRDLTFSGCQRSTISSR